MNEFFRPKSGRAPLMELSKRIINIITFTPKILVSTDLTNNNK